MGKCPAHRSRDAPRPRQASLLRQPVPKQASQPAVWRSAADTAANSAPTPKRRLSTRFDEGADQQEQRVDKGGDCEAKPPGSKRAETLQAGPASNAIATGRTPGRRA